MEVLMKKSAFYLLCVFLFASISAWAAAGGDTAERTAKTCAGCHGTYGASPGEFIPVIGGQHAEYLKKVLLELKGKKRPHSIEMTLMASGYTDEQLEAISEWYADKKWADSKVKVNEYNMSATVSLIENYSCFGCHVDNGKGEGEAPAITGQAPGYLKNVLMKYKAGLIPSDEMAFLKDVSEVEIDAMVSYLTELGRNR
jgi:sulfide dehydrogenase cytochrome subunit